MIGQHGKSAKSAPRASFSKSARPNSTMATAGGNGSIRSRASSSASEPERLSLTSRGPSPYNSKLTTAGLASGGGDSNTKRRVQSAATTRQRSALGGPTIKASELFRKNHSEPQLANTNNTKSGTNNQNSSFATPGKPKSVKHVRIDTEANFSDNSLKTTLNTAENLLGIHGTKAPNRGESGRRGSNSQQRRPFSFCSDRSRSVSVTSNESCSTYESEFQNDDGMQDRGGDADTQDIYWKKDYENNNPGKVNIKRDNFDSQRATGSRVGVNPRLSKRSFSMDTGEIMDSDQEDNFWSDSPQDFHSQMIEMKIAEHPEETLRAENRSSSASARRVSQESVKSQLNRTFTEDLSVEEGKKLLRSASSGAAVSKENKNQTVKSSDFDRMLLMQSDNLLQGVTDLINEIKSTDTCKKLQKPSISSSTSMSKADSVEKLVADLRNDINKQMHDSLGSKGDSPEQHEMVDERYNFNTLDLSGIELNDITCPSQVMEQSVPNTGRFERPLSAVVLGNNNNGNGTKLSNDIISEAESYLLMNREKSSVAQNSNNNNESTDGFESSSDSNNQTFSSSGALSIIQQQTNSASNSARRGDSGGGGGGAPAAQHKSGFDMNQEEIQRKICSALKLLEEEEKARRDSMTPRRGNSERSQSPFMSVSNPDSRSSSRGGGRGGGDSAKSSPTPRIRSEERNIPYGSYDSHHSNMQKGMHDRVAISNQNLEGRNFSSEPQSARSCSCITEHVSSESLGSARSSKTTIGTVGRTYNSNSDGGRNAQTSRIHRPSSGCEGMWEAKDDKTNNKLNAPSRQIFSFLDEVEKSDQEMLFGLRFETDCLGRPKATGSNTMTVAGISNSESIMGNAQSALGKKNANEETQFRTMDSLIRKGSVELAREILMLERKLDEAHHAVKLLEESLLNQRELNIRNLRNSERDFKKRMKMQKEEFEMAFSRNEALINEMVAEKRVLQDKFDKLIKNFEDMDEKHKEHVKSMQQKHLDEIRRLRKMQQNAETSLKKNLAGNKAQAHEIREMTVKGLEPEVQRIIQRHQQEMSEMRAWHADEVSEIEARYQRKLHVQLEDIREKFAKEKEDLIAKERELANRRLEADLKQKEDEIENLKRRHTNELFEERERAVTEEMRFKDSVQDSVRKAQIKGEVELENLKQDYEAKLANLERRHESELKSLKDVLDAERQNWASNQMKKLEQALSDQEVKLKEAFQAEKEREWRDKERKLKEEFEKFRKDDENASESRFRRMQEKLQTELNEMEKTEKDMKSKFCQAKTDLLAREEEIFSLKTSISMKDKQLIDLQDMNMKMQEERVNLTSVIRREFTDQIQAIEEECRSLKATMVEIQSNSKLQVEQKQLEIEKIISEKDSEIEKIGLRVKQALGRKDETILELQKQLEKASFQISHLEQLLEEQRKEFLHGMTKMPSGGGGVGRGHRK